MSATSKLINEDLERRLVQVKNQLTEVKTQLDRASDQYSQETRGHNSLVLNSFSFVAGFNPKMSRYFANVQKKTEEISSQIVSHQQKEISIIRSIDLRRNAGFILSNLISRDPAEITLNYLIENSDIHYKIGEIGKDYGNATKFQDDEESGSEVTTEYSNDPKLHVSKNASLLKSKENPILFHSTHLIRERKLFHVVKFHNLPKANYGNSIAY
jgi:hypothetical protein